MRLRSLALLGGLLLLLLPAAAFAQSAGDEQYTDPLATPPSSNQPSSQSPSQSTPPQHAGTPSSGAGVASDTSQGSTASAGDQSSDGSSLPRTGFRSWMLAVMGGLMLLAGLLLRLGLRPLPQRAGGMSPPTLGRDIRLTSRR